MDDLLTRLALGVVEGADRGLPLPVRLCRAAATILEVDGGAITLAYTHPERVTVATTGDIALTIEEAQDVLGQGPGPDAFTSGAYTRLDLGAEGEDSDPRWPLLESGELSALAPISIHAVPLVDGGSVLGVLTLHRRGLPSEIDLGAAGAVARVLTAALLADGPTQQEAGNGPWSERAEIHQATGMVVAQLRVPEGDALALIRAHAYSHDQSVARSAHEIVARRVTFSASPEQDIESS